MPSSALFRFAVVWPDGLKDPGPVDARARDHYWRNVLQPLIVGNIGHVLALQWQPPQIATDNGTVYRIHVLLVQADTIPPVVARNAYKVVEDNPTPAAPVEGAPVEVLHADH